MEHDEYAPLLLKIIDRVIEGDSRRSVVIELNEDKVPTSRDIDRRRHPLCQAQSQEPGEDNHPQYSRRGSLWAALSPIAS